MVRIARHISRVSATGRTAGGRDNALVQLRGLAPRVLQPQLRVHIVDLPRPRQHEVPHVRRCLLARLHHTCPLYQAYVRLHFGHCCTNLQLPVSDALMLLAYCLGALVPECVQTWEKTSNCNDTDVRAVRVFAKPATPARH